jgi:hypothetical protein
MDGAHIRRQLSYVEESRSLLAQGERVRSSTDLADIRTLVARCRLLGQLSFSSRLVERLRGAADIPTSARFRDGARRQTAGVIRTPAVH